MKMVFVLFAGCAVLCGSATGAGDVGHPGRGSPAIVRRATVGARSGFDLAGAVPRPAACGMMLLGVGLVGAGARRRRPNMAAA